MPSDKGGRRRRIETIFAQLTRKPFNLSLDECGRLTIHQVQAIFGHACDDNGVLETRYDGPEEERLTQAEKFIRDWQAKGLRRDQAERKWAEWLEEAAYRRQIEVDVTAWKAEEELAFARSLEGVPQAEAVKRLAAFKRAEYERGRLEALRRLTEFQRGQLEKRQ